MNDRVVVSNRPVRYLQSFVTSKVCMYMYACKYMVYVYDKISFMIWEGAIE